MPGLLFVVLIPTWCATLALLHIALSWKLVSTFQRAVPTASDSVDWPGVVAILSLRGRDEFLDKTLGQLATLDYPNYRLRVVLDSETDPARAVVDQFMTEHRPQNIDVLYLGERPVTCTSKLAGILRGTEQLPDDCAAVAVFDGDAAIHSTCLKELVAPLRQGVALTTGNRWYAPARATMGGLVRYLWNGFALTIMSVVQIPWGGCMAMQRNVIDDPELRRRLLIGFSDEAILGVFVRERRWRIQFVPEATIVNQETVKVPEFYRFLVRQYLLVRMHHPRWDFILVSNVLLGITTTAAHPFLYTVSGPLWWPAFWGYIIIIVALCIEIGTGSYLVRRRMARNGLQLPKFSFAHWVRLPTALFVLGHLNLVACLHAQFTREHVWRGITYRFRKNLPVEIVDVRPLTGSVPS